MTSRHSPSTTRITRLFTKTVLVSLLLVALLFLVVIYEKGAGYLSPAPSVSFTFYQGNVSTTSIANLSIVNNEVAVRKYPPKDKEGLEGSRAAVPLMQEKTRLIEHRNKKIETPKVALLYLSLGELHNEPIWKAFFEAAGRLEFRTKPSKEEEESYVHGSHEAFFKKVNNIKDVKSGRSLRSKARYKKRSSSSNCRKESRYMKLETQRLLSGSERGKDVIQRQNLFTVYTHPHPNYSFPKNSIFHGTEIGNRVDTSNAWGSFRLVAAEVWLLKSALKDKNNQRFALLSESCIPLHRPEVVYLQFLSETKSRINGCHPWAKKNKMFRWTGRMQTKYVKAWKWRFSSQWFALKRSHVEIITGDTHVRRQFRWSCLQRGPRACIPDEHYMPTALAVYGVGNETDCIGKMTALRRGRYRSHAITFPSKFISVPLFNKLKNVDGCHLNDTLASTKKVFKGGLSDGGCLKPTRNKTMTVDVRLEDNWVLQSGYVPLSYRCSIFARKFSKTTVKKTLETALSCTGVGLGHWC